MKLDRLIFIFVVVTFFSCSKDGGENFAGGNNSGQGGSLARFVYSQDRLYGLKNSELTVFDVSNPEKMVLKHNMFVGAGLETLFPQGNRLFVGSQSGTYIYDITNMQPNLLASIWHLTACDPVVATETHAYVTLRSLANVCGRNTNELQVYDITDVRTPKLVETVQLTNPIGLGIYQNRLFVCDDNLKEFNIDNPSVPLLVNQHDIKSFDLIPRNTVLMTIGDDGLSQYLLQDGAFEFLSNITLGEKTDRNLSYR